jgi:hypothetical protein
VSPIPRPLFILAPLREGDFIGAFMSSSPPTPPGNASPRPSQNPFDSDFDQNGGIDLKDVFGRLCRGFAPTLGFAVLGLAIGACVDLAISPFSAVTTSMRVTFAFNGFGVGEYPDHSKFQPDDIREPDIVAEALKEQGLESLIGSASSIRAALTIEGIIPPEITKERDRLRAAGQTPGAYNPDEYLITLTLPRKFPLNSQQRELLLNAIVSVYRQKFSQTYSEAPLAFGNAFKTLRDTDYSEYELVLTEEIQSMTDYLRQQLNTNRDETEPGTANVARTFRSRTTNLSFPDLLEQTRLFAQIRLNQTLGQIYENGVSRDRATAIMKMDYFIRTLRDQEQRAIEEEKVVDDLLAKAQDRSQNYVLGVKSQVAQQHPESPILDQGLIDSLLANDAYNFLVHKALDSGLAVRRIQSDIARLMERRKNMEKFLSKAPENQVAINAHVKESLEDLEKSYNELITNIRKTHADFANQQFADAIRITMQPVTGGRYLPAAKAGIVGGLIGLALGLGLSLLGIYVGIGRRAT